MGPLGLAGVKIVGDYVDKYTRGLPSEMALLNLFDPRTGMPVALLDATAITEMRTGAMTALGAKYLARRDSRILGHIGARGTAYSQAHDRGLLCEESCLAALSWKTTQEAFLFPSTGAEVRILFSD